MFSCGSNINEADKELSIVSNVQNINNSFARDFTLVYLRGNVSFISKDVKITVQCLISFANRNANKTLRVDLAADN